MKITTTGKRNGEKITVEITEGRKILKYRFNGKPDYDLQTEIEMQIGRIPVGGVYWAETKELQILAVLTSAFYDSAPSEVLAEGIFEEVPQPAGKDAVY